MKPLQGRVTSSQSCSCTSCTKSGSQHPLYKEFIAKGSKIDKLFLEDFIPLHERKLLGKLVRTRAVYDDIRNQLLSGSDLSISQQPDLKPSYIQSNSNGSEKIGALLELVNLVDKGATLGPRKASECCSCCSCSSTIPINEHEGRTHTHRHGRVQISSRLSIFSRKAKDERRLSKLRRKTKHIHSDPCTCTSQLSGSIATESKAVIRKLRAHMPKSKTGSPPVDFRDINEAAVKDYKIKHAGMGEIIRKSLTKVRQSQTRISNKIKGGTKQSLENIKKTAHKINNKIGDSARKSKKSATVIAPPQNVFEKENTFDIRKDSLMKYRDEIERKKLLKEYECAFGCNPDECEPVECLKILKKNKTDYMMNDLNKHHKNEIEDTSAFESGVQAQTTKTNAKIATKNLVEKNKSLEINAKISTKNQAVKNKKAEKKKDVKLQDACLCESTGSKTELKMKTIKTNTSLLAKPAASSGLKLKRCYCTLKLKSKKKILKSNGVHQNTTTSQSVQSISKSLQTTQQLVLHPDECEPGFCVMDKCDPVECLKRIRKRRKNYFTMTNTKEVKSSSKSTPRLKIPARSRISGGSRKLKTYKTGRTIHSESSQQNSVSKTSQENKNDKQAVRISSKFSFDIEFYKQTQNPSQIAKKTYAVLDDENKLPHKRKQLMNNKQSSTNQRTKSQGSTFESLQKSSSTQAKDKVGEVAVQSAMKRCFCTLQLRKMGRNTKLNLISTGTETALLEEEMYPRIEMATKSTRMKKKSRLTPQLEPNECEPDFCIPGQCDPYQCLERMKIRDSIKSKEFGAGTNASKMKSTSSATDKHKRSKDAISQSRDKVKHMKRYNYTLPANSSEIESLQKTPSRQVVRIGSNFSFNIEFSKSHTSSKHGVNQQVFVEPKTTKDKGDNSRKSGRQSTAQTEDIKTINKASHIRPMLKRCFCTLKLQKKRLSKNAPTVMPVIIKTHALSTPIQKDLIAIQSDKFSNNIYSTRYSSSNSKTSYFNSESDIDIKSYQINSRKYNMNRYCTIYSKNSLVSKDNKASHFGVNQFMNNNFYALNIQVKNKQKVSYKLEPYECEPGICVPGQCNPIECQKLIMKRLMKKASTMTNSMKRSQSISSGTVDLKSKKQQSNQATTKVQKVKKEKQGIEYKTMPKSHKQAVRVGSSFSFNIEFFKENNQQQVKEVAEKKVTSKKNKMQNSTSTNTKFNKKYSDSTNADIYNQSRTSQSSVTMQDKGSSAKMKLQRCFCTLKLQKKGKLNKDIRLATEKKAEIKKEVTKTSDASQNTKKMKPFSLSDLDPNECEPNVCIPGECDPYKCLERIERRGIKRNTKDFGTDMVKPQGLSTSSMTTGQKNVARGNQKPKIRDKPAKIVKPLHKTHKSSRQAVRIGSNFGFNVEFFKEKSFPGDSTKMLTSSPSKKQPKTKSQYNETDVNSKSQAIQEFKPIRHQDSQVINPAQHDKSTKTGSFLKRCFCTLNLHGKETLKKLKSQNTTAVKPKPKEPETSSTAFVQTKKIKEKPDKTKLNLEPYECEPGVCVPGECDPHICAQRINKRNAINKMSSTEGSGTASVATLYQSPKLTKSSYAQNKTKKDKTQIKTPSPKQVSNTENIIKMPERNVVRIGSNFSFNIEFYKEKFPTFDNVQKAAKKIKEQRKLKPVGTKTKPIAKPKGVSKNISQQSNESQTRSVPKNDKASTVSPMLKRCFCTLSLQKDKREKDALQNVAKIEMVTKGTETPKKMNKAYKLEPYECEPGVCTPGQCNPHECLKRIQKRMQSKMSNTEAPKEKQITPLKGIETPRKMNKAYKLEPYECEPGVCTPGQCNPHECLKRIQKRMQSKMSNTEAPKEKQITTLKSKPASSSAKTATTRLQKQTRSTRKPSNLQSIKKSASKYPLNQNRQAVRIGSNFSFNIDFFKDASSDNADRINLRQIHSIEKTTAPTSQKNKNVAQTYQTKAVDRQLQAQNYKTESKASAAEPLLKRCFCTLKLQKVGRQHVGTRNKSRKNNLEVQSKLIKSTPTKASTESPSHHKALTNPKLKESGIAPYLKRCFCTLTLHKTETNKLQLAKCNVGCPQAQSKATSTKKKIERKELDPYECEPGICIPGQCDPYKCLKIIKQRGIHRISRTTGTRSDRSRYNSITTSSCEPGCKSRGLQSEDENINVVEELRFPLLDRKNWQGLKIGSNISLSIEFYKEINVMPLSQKQVNNSKSVLKSTKPALTPSQKLTNEASVVRNALKKCFCTSEQEKQLQNNIITVGRVDKISTMSPYKTQTKFCNCLERIKPGQVGVKTKSKKVNTKHLESAINSKQQVKFADNVNKVPSSSNQFEKSNNRKKKAGGVVNTILPYTPKKFNKHKSKTSISLKENIKGTEYNCQDEKCNNKLKHSKGFTKKEETKLYHQKPVSGPKRFLCHCMQVFSKSRDVKIYSNTNTDQYKDFKRNGCPNYCPGILKNNTQRLNPPVSRSMNPQSDGKTDPGPGNKGMQRRGSLKSAITLNNKIISQNEKKTILHSGDTVKKHDEIMAPLYKTAVCPHCQHLIEKLLDTPQQQHAKLNHKSFKSSNQKFFNSHLKHVENKSCPCAKTNYDEPPQPNGAKLKINAKSKRHKYVQDDKNLSYLQQNDSYSILQFGDSAQVGDPKLEQPARFSNKKLVCPHCQKNITEGQVVQIKYQGPIIERAINNMKFYNDRVSSAKEKPDKQKYSANLKEPVVENVIPNSEDKKLMNPFVALKSFILLKLLKCTKCDQRHGELCSCCICKAKSQPLEAKVTKANDVTKEKINKPCVCGSKICAKESKKQKKTKTDKITAIDALKKKKPCVCGSPVCAKELAKIAKSKTTGKKSLNTCVCNVLCQCVSSQRKASLLKRNILKSKKLKLKAMHNKKNQQELRKRQAIYKKEDKIRRRLRRKKDKKMLKEVLKSKEAGDCMLLADSLIDIGKLSCTTVCDVTRSVFRAVRDPRRTADNVKSLYKDPERACEGIKSALGDSGIASTYKRIKMRVGAMRRVKGTMNTLEQYAATNYMIHSCDKDPKKKHHPRKKKKTRIPLDFQCSPFMASLRKKPWLAVYYSCPWFYPHCISLLNVWKQFTDVCLFLLAVVVWSPCIFLMEACRGALCCMLCTG